MLSLTVAVFAMSFPQTGNAAEDKPTAVHISGTTSQYLISIEHASGKTTAYSGNKSKLQDGAFTPLTDEPGVLVGLHTGNFTSPSTLQPLKGKGYDAKSIGMQDEWDSNGFDVITVMLKEPVSNSQDNSSTPVSLSAGVLRPGVTTAEYGGPVFLTVSRANGDVSTNVLSFGQDSESIIGYANYCVNSRAILNESVLECQKTTSTTSKINALTTKLTDIPDIPGVRISKAYAEAGTNPALDIVNKDMGVGYQLTATHNPGVLVALKDKPTASPTMAVQMPTTGAPDGLSAVGLAAVMVTVFGLLLVAAQRRS